MEKCSIRKIDNPQLICLDPQYVGIGAILHQRAGLHQVIERVFIFVAVFQECHCQFIVFFRIVSKPCHCGVDVNAIARKVAHLDPAVGDRRVGNLSLQVI